MIIGLSGYARSGKDTVANILVEKHGFTRIAFADPIREFLYEIDPPLGGPSLRSIVDEYGWDVAKANPEVRRLLQKTGVAARKQFSPTFWVDQAMKKIYNPDKDFVITDVRFKNEADWLLINGAYIWRVNRSSTGPINGHVSETELDDYQFMTTIENDGTLDGLELVVTRLYNDTKNPTLWSN